MTACQHTATHATALARDGWILACLAITPAGVATRVRAAPHGTKLRVLASNMGGLLSNWLIALLQLASNPGAWRDGKWRIVHLGIVRIADGITYLYQSTWPHGVHRVPLLQYLADYPAAILLPLRPPLAIEDYDALGVWLDDRVGMRYNTAGLTSVLTNGLLDDPASYFCSQLTAGAHQDVGLLPMHATRLGADGRPRRTNCPDGWWSPSEHAREDGVVDWDNAIYVRGDLWHTTT